MKFRFIRTMFNAINQITSSSQFYLYGRSNFTQTGWEKISKTYASPDILQDLTLDLSDKVYMVTGANAGIGSEIAKFLASRRASVYLVCRNLGRAEAFKKSIVDDTHNANVHLLCGDC